VRRVLGARLLGYAGNNVTRIVLLPGMDGTDAFFRPFVTRCPPGMTVQTVEYDRVEATSYDSLCEHVAALLPDSEFCALGWSFSGPLALKLAARNIPGLRGIILVTTFAWRPMRHLPAWCTRFVRPSMFTLYPLASMGQALLQGYSTPELRALQSEAFARTTPSSLATRVRMLLEVDVRSELRSCPVPILYLRASQDRVIHRGHGQQILAEAPRATLVDLPGPHLCLATHPDDAWNAIEAFVRGQSL
jgi:pimeloyl-[acyl-carrier protein] methyl ester esterase